MPAVARGARRWDTLHWEMSRAGCNMETIQWKVQQKP